MTNGRKIILTSFTGEYASGGVPRWVRDFRKGFPEAESYSWQDVANLPGSHYAKTEWDKAKFLNSWLLDSGRRKPNDIVIGDGWWAGLYFPNNTVSVCHGIWSHLIKEEVDAGFPPDMPRHHKEQVAYRKNSGAKLVAVSKFIQHQMKIQFGFDSEVINNAIDLEEFKPVKSSNWTDEKLIIHGVNDRGNKNKGWDHIQHLKDNIKDVKILSLDEAYSEISQGDFTKYEVLSMADLVVIPSGYEGNSYFALETLSCDVPIVSYDIGLFYEIKGRFDGSQRFMPSGRILNRKERSKEKTLAGVQNYIANGDDPLGTISSRDIAKDYSIQNFHKQWKDYLKKEFDYGC